MSAPQATTPVFGVATECRVAMRGARGCSASSRAYDLKTVTVTGVGFAKRSSTGQWASTTARSSW
jgi:hypothetical protein